MASTQKQAKRAKRAKTKAKQARTVRNSTPTGVSLDSDLMNDLALGMADMLPRLAEAEVISQVEMLTTLIRETGLSEAKSLDDEIDTQILILKVYGQKIEGRSADWMEHAKFLEAYAEAARKLDREELIQAWNDAHDF